MPDTLPPSVPTGSARAARTAGKKLEFARQYCSQCPVPIQLISRHARSLDATRKLQRIRTHKKRNRESPRAALAKNPSTRLSQEPCLGVNTNRKRPSGRAASQALVSCETCAE